MKMILLTVCVAAMMACEKKGSVSSFKPDHEFLLQDVTTAADDAYIAKNHAEKDATNEVKAVDYARAAAKMDEAKSKAEAAGIDPIIIMGAESQGAIDAMEILKKWEEKRAADAVE